MQPQAPAGGALAGPVHGFAVSRVPSRSLGWRWGSLPPTLAAASQQAKGFPVPHLATNRAMLRAGAPIARQQRCLTVVAQVLSDDHFLLNKLINKLSVMHVTSPLLGSHPHL